MRISVNTVLYTEDFEPITVLQLTESARQVLDAQGRVRLHVQGDFDFRWLADPEPPATFIPKIVEIWAEGFTRGGRVTWFLFTRDDENALLLRSAFLPGQRRDLRDERAEAFGRGFLKALTLL